jgi:hypothetical protein
MALLTMMLIGNGSVSLAPVVSGSGTAGQPADDRVLLPDAPRWARWASTGVSLMFTARGRMLMQPARRGTAPRGGSRRREAIPGVGIVFNKDQSARPQNETSVAVDPANIDRVVGVYHDYRLDAPGIFGGWSISRNGGASVDKEGHIPGFSSGCSYPRCIGGEPTVDTDGQGNFFVSGWFYDAANHTNGIVIARSPKAGSPQGVFSAACTGGSDTDCWPTVKSLTASACSYSGGYFDDNPYVAADDTSLPAAGHVYVVWTRFTCPAENDLASSIMIAKCDNALTACTAPATLDYTPGTGAPLDFVQHPHIAVAPGGGVYVTWVRNSAQTMETQVAKIMQRKVKPTSSLTSVGTLGVLRTVHSESKPIPWGFAPYPAYFRTSTYSRVAVRGTRVIVVWNRRTTTDTVWARPGLLGWWFDYGTGASIVAKYSDDYGATWSSPQTITGAAGAQYQPSICVDPASGKVAIAYYSHQNNPLSARAQDVYVAISSNGLAPYAPLRVTAASNDPEADRALGDLFIGDHLEIACRSGRAYIHYTGNYEPKWYCDYVVGVGGGGFYANQQDNFLARLTLP